MAANNDETCHAEDAQLHKAYSTLSHSGKPDVYQVSERVAARVAGRTIRSFNEYKALYSSSLEDNEGFWKEQALKTLDWIRPFDQVTSGGFKAGDVAWFLNGQLNACYNCVDRHVPTKGDKPAIIWEGDAPGTVKHITYKELLQEVSRFANLLKSLGVKKGDRVAIYMPMVPQAAYAMLACARIGAVHNVVFAGFSAEALRDRINNAQVEVVITADEGMRGGRSIPLKKVVDEAVAQCPTVRKVVVLRHTGGKVNWTHGRDLWLHENIELQRPYCPAEPMNSEDLLFLLYTSGSTGAPKGLAHTTAGYLLYASLTHRHVFDYQDGDVYACVADIGWITGHSYILYGPLLNGATTLMFESVPTFPDAGRYWDLVARHKVNLFYTAPTAIRTLMSFGDAPVKKHDRSSLRVLGSVGEPINPEAWRWYHNVVGDGKCSVVDTYWQTETGGIVVTPLPGATPTKPGSATFPFFGIDTAVLDPQTGKELKDNDVSGVLAIRRPWPGIARTVYGDHARYVKTYFSQYPGFYFTGDGCVRDKDGYIWITGRVDDVINKAGHRIGTAEVESALVGHAACAEAAVIGIDDKVKGQAIFAYVSVNKDVEVDEEKAIANLKAEVRKRIGSLAVPDYIVITPYLPKTRSGKIMRRVLRKIAAGESDQLGDTSTLADPDSLQGLIKKVDFVLKDHQR